MATTSPRWPVRAWTWWGWVSLFLKALALTLMAETVDFGLAKVHGLEDSKGAGGTPYYMAPEVLNSDPYDSKADIYAFAIILWELVTQKPPYSDQKMARGAAGLAQLYSHVFVDKKRLPVMPPPSPPPCRSGMWWVWRQRS